jgi:hypothetical protein
MEASPNLIYRIARDRMLDLAPALSAVPANDILVEPEYFLPHLSQDTLVVGTVEENTTATITLPLSQPDVRYQLFYKSGVKVGPPMDGNCGPISFETPPLAREWHEFYIEATKLNIDLPIPGARKLRIDVWINAGNNDGIDPQPMLKILDYGAGYDFVIPDAPPFIRFKLRNRAGTYPYLPQESGGSGGLITFPIPAMYENDNWFIEAYNINKQLDHRITQVPAVYVYPNPDLFVCYPDLLVIPYLGRAAVTVINTQISCTYILFDDGLADDVWITDPADMDDSLPQPVNGNGDLLTIYSRRLADDVTARVKATKVESPDLENPLALFLKQTVQVRVYPNPTLRFELSSTHIPYGEQTQLRFPLPQMGVVYQVENSRCQILAPGQQSGRMAREIAWWLGPFMEDDVIRLRAFRHGVNSLMDLSLDLFVGPNLDLLVTFAQDEFLPENGTSIYVEQTQASAKYLLYKIPGTDSAWGDPIHCATVNGNADTIAIPTGPLPDFRYQFYVVACKINSGMEGQLYQTVEVELQVRTEIAATILPNIIPYGGVVEAILTPPQRFTMYKMVDELGTSLGPWSQVVDGAPQHFIKVSNLREDLTVFVLGQNIYTGHTALLTTNAAIWVYPNPDLILLIPEPNIDYGNMGQLRIHNSQASVAYHITASPLFPFAYIHPIPPVAYTARPSVDGVFDFDFGPLTYPVSFELVATKPNTGLSVTIASPPLEIRTRPNHLLLPEIVDNNIPFDEYAVVVVQPTEPLTYYEVRDAEGNPLGPRGFSESEGTVVLDCGPFQEDIDLYVWAFCELTQLQAVTATPAHLQVCPYMDYQLSLLERPFDPQQGLKVHVSRTQVSADYTLYLIAGDEQGWLPGRTPGTTQAGTGAAIILHSGALPHLRYTLYVHAQKRVSGLFGRGFSALTVYAGIRRDCIVNLDDSRVPFGYAITLQIENLQPDADYRIFTRNGNLLGAFPSPGEGQMKEILLAPIFDDTQLNIRCTNQCTGRTESLDARPSVEVGPNGNLFATPTAPIFPWQGNAFLNIPNAQPNVRYQAVLLASNDPGWGNNIPLNQVIAQDENLPAKGFNMRLGFPANDGLVRIRAIKANGLDAWLPTPVPYKVGPNPTLAVTALTSQVVIGQLATISVQNPQPGVCYQLRNTTTGQLVGPRFYAGPVSGMQQLVQQYSVTYVQNSLNVLQLRTPPITARTIFEVQALKLINGATVFLNNTATIRVF